MQAWAELVAAVVVGLAMAVLGAFGVDTDGERDDERRVRRVPVSATAVTIPTRSDPDVSIACAESSGHA